MSADFVRTICWIKWRVFIPFSADQQTLAAEGGSVYLREAATCTTQSSEGLRDRQKTQVACPTRKVPSYYQAIFVTTRPWTCIQVRSPTLMELSFLYWAGYYWNKESSISKNIINKTSTKMSIPSFLRPNRNWSSAQKRSRFVVDRIKWEIQMVIRGQVGGKVNLEFISKLRTEEKKCQNDY